MTVRWGKFSYSFYLALSLVVGVLFLSGLMDLWRWFSSPGGWWIPSWVISTFCFCYVVLLLVLGYVLRKINVAKKK